MRALLVDAEPRVLEGISRILFEVDASWELITARSTDEALAALSQQPCDAVVAELHGAGLDGVALLTRVAELHPRTLRIVLSGHDDRAAALDLVHVAHQFLPKPCAAETLHRVLARLEELTRLLPERKLQVLATQAGALPCTPRLHQRLLELVDAGNDSAGLASIIREDPGLAGKLLQLAGSAFFGGASGVADIETGAIRIGTPTLRLLAQSLGAPPPLRPSAMPTVSAVETAQQRATAIARVAASLARLPEDAAAAYLAGLLCDVGQLLLVRAAPERLYVTQAEAGQRGVPDHVAELATWGATHAELGAFLLGIWGLPFQIVEAVANHHTPERAEGDRLGLTQLVWLAACVVEDEQPSPELLSRFGAEDVYRRARLTFRETLA
jgi:HD-like signal output (HDOD) protein